MITVDKPTARSAMNVSSVSPLHPTTKLWSWNWFIEVPSSPNQLNPNGNISYLRWLVITPQPARLDILTASILSVTDPIWLTWQNKPQNWISKVSTDEEKQEQCYSECQHYNDTLRRRALQVFSLIAFSTLCTNENRGKRGKKPSSIGGQTST